MLGRMLRFAIEQKPIVLLATLLVVAWGAMVAPFPWDTDLPRDPVPVDAIPDIGENQQIVFTEWMGRSPQDIDDQITYPLTVALLGMPKVRTVRSYSYFGFSSIYVIFEDDAEFYWSRSRVLEKLASLPDSALPEGVRPRLGPDATALGQIFWYSLEGQDADGRPTGGWDLDELRSVQDWFVRDGLQAAEGVSEVASIGGFVREYQIDVDPAAMRAANVTLDQVVRAVRQSNVDVGARTIEVNKVEYVIRGLGFIESIRDIESTAIKARDNLPIVVGDVAKVSLGPALRRGALDKAGAEVVGGVVVVRYGENPLEVIDNVKAKIAEISSGLPKKTLDDGTVSQVRIVPFYDRSGLIHETLDTLSRALWEEILVSIVVILVMVRNLRSSLLISALLPIAVLMSFIAMRVFGVEANVVALSGIAIAIGTMVDMGIIVSENILKHLSSADDDEPRNAVVLRAVREVSGAVLTAIATTVLSFLPVFTLEAAEGKLFRPLAFTKTAALVASVIVALFLIPPLASLVFGVAARKRVAMALGVVAAIGAAIAGFWIVAAAFALAVVWAAVGSGLPASVRRGVSLATTAALAIAATAVLAGHWQPLGPTRSALGNFAFVALILGGLLGAMQVLLWAYPRLLAFFLRHKPLFLALPIAIVCFGVIAWLGFARVAPDAIADTGLGRALDATLPGIGKEFMPALDEGSYLYMPSTMPHASIGESLDALQKQDRAFDTIPEIEQVVGKIGRVDSPLDPAPIGMVETVLNYRSEYALDERGRRMRFRWDPDANDWARDRDGTVVPAADGKPYVVRGRFARGDDGRLIEDPDGRPFRQWRPAVDPALNPGRDAWPGIREPDDIWERILVKGTVPGSTSAPKLQPISTRLVMLQSGMRAPLGIKVKGPDLETIERVCRKFEAWVKEVPSVRRGAVIADRIVGKPYLEIDIDRQAIARHGLSVRSVQDVIEVAIGGRRITTTVENRARYPVRVRYLRELRDSIESLNKILIPGTGGEQVPLEQVASIRFVRGPMVIKSEDAFLVGYVLFDKLDEHAEVDVVEDVRAHLAAKIARGEFRLPPNTSYAFAGTYEQQLRAEKKLLVVVPLALFLIFGILYLQFRSTATSLLVFSGVAVAWAGGFIMLWLYTQPWFLDVTMFGAPLRDLLQVNAFNLSVAVWVGFLALFGIATDDGVVMATVLDRTFDEHDPRTVDEIRAATIAAGTRRVRPCLMTTATTLLALIPVMTSTGRGSDIMVPMAIPSFGGMFFVAISMFVVPVLYCAIREAKLAIATRP